MTDLLSLESLYGADGLLGTRPVAPYNEAERWYSRLLLERLEELLKGQRNTLLLLRRYPAQPNRLGVMPTPVGLDRPALRIQTVEKLAVTVIVFMSENAPGGPVAQHVDEHGRIVESRHYLTRHPHIVLDRVDVYQPGEPEPESIEWCARRLQNQHSSTLVNRTLDAANLALDLTRYLTR